MCGVKTVSWSIMALPSGVCPVTTRLRGGRDIVEDDLSCGVRESERRADDPLGQRWTKNLTMGNVD